MTCLKKWRNALRVEWTTYKYLCESDRIEPCYSDFVRKEVGRFLLLRILLYVLIATLYLGIFSWVAHGSE